MSTPRMTDIPTALRVLDTCLARCGAQPLQLLYRNYHLERESWGLLKKSAINTRISKLHVVSCVTQLGRIPRLTTWLRSPALKEVHIQGATCRESSGEEFWSAPQVSDNVESFILEDIVPTRHLFFKPPPLGLRHFHLVMYIDGSDRACYLPILSYLAAMPRLQSLDIRGLDFVDERDWEPAPLPGPGEAVLLEEMEHLRLKGTKAALWWVAHVVMPNLRLADMEVCATEPEIMAARPMPSGILEQTSARSLTSLVMRRWEPDIVLLLIFVAPHLERLVTCAGVWFRHLQPDDRVYLKFPSLKRLDLSYDACDPQLGDHAEQDRTRGGDESNLEVRNRLGRFLVMYVLQGSWEVAPGLETVSIFPGDGNWTADDVGTTLAILSAPGDTLLLER